MRGPLGPWRTTRRRAVAIVVSALHRVESESSEWPTDPGALSERTTLTIVTDPKDIRVTTGAAPRVLWTRRCRRRCLLALIAALACWLLVHLAWIIGDGVIDEGRTADVAVILGNRVDPSGQPSPWLRARLDRGLSLYRAGRVRALIVSGGLGVEGHEEATVMKRYLVERGVPAARVLEDRDGYNTFRTANNTRALMRARGDRSAFVVSQYYRVARSKLALRRAGVCEVYGARARLELGPRDLWSVSRELLALPLYYLRWDFERAGAENICLSNHVSIHASAVS